MAETEAELLRADRLVCGYSADDPVLRDISLHMQRGEIVFMLGGSGSGKSTLLRSLCGLLPPLDGRVRLLGEDLYALDGAERRAVLRRAGMLFQHDALFGSLNVLENIALPVLELTRIPKPVAYEMSRAKLALVELSPFEQRKPSELSGGQRKRVALARAAVLDPVILFCDEPTSGLDPATSSHIDRTLLRMRDVLQVAILAVTHDVESVRAIADRAIVLDAGHVCEQGPFESLAHSEHPAVHALLHRGEPARAGQRFPSA